MKNWYFFNFLAAIEDNPLFVSPRIKSASGLIFFKISEDLIIMLPID